MAYIDSTTNSGNSSTPSVSVPTGVGAGDEVILVVGFDNSSAAFDSGDLPTGFTELDEQAVTADGHKGWVGWKRLTGSDTGSYTFGDVGVTNDWVCQAIAFSGRHSTNPPVISTANIQNTPQSNPITVSANGVTAVAGDDLVWISVPDVTSPGAGNGHDPPTNYTEAEDAENTWANLSLAYRENVSAGATGTVSGTFNLSQDTAGWVAWLVRLPEAAADAQTVEPSSIASAEAFGTASVQLNIDAASITSAEAFGTASVQLNINVVGIPSEEAVGTPTISPVQVIETVGITSAEAFGSATVLRQGATPSKSQRRILLHHSDGFFF